MTRAFPLLAIPALVALMAGAVLATGTGSPAPTTDQEPILIELDRQTQERDAMQIDAVHGEPIGLRMHGVITDSAGTPVPGVMVKLFENGLLIGEALSDEVGVYSLTGDPDQTEGCTVDLWFQSPDPQKYLDRNYVILKSGVAEEHGLFPGCTKTLTFMRGQTEINPVLLSEVETKAELAESKCLESGTGS